MRTQELSRTRAVLGKDTLDRLLKAKVLIAGLGGVGGYSLEALVRMGVSNFILIDSDLFEESNINRQILCTSNNIGQAKCFAARERVLSINPEANVEALNVFIDESNIDTLLDFKPDVVIDAIDSVNSKCLLLIKCKENGIPVVSSMGAAMRKDPLQVRECDISKTFGCPLAKKVRTVLKQHGITYGIRCVFSPEHLESIEEGILGSLPTVVGTFGFALAKLAVDCIEEADILD